MRGYQFVLVIVALFASACGDVATAPSPLERVACPTGQHYVDATTCVPDVSTPGQSAPPVENK